MRRLLIGIVWLYFLVLLIGPISYLAHQSIREGLTVFWTEISRPEALHGFTLTAEITVIVLGLNLVFGTMTALVLTRQQFWGRSLISGVIDLPFAVSPVIAGFMLILLFGPDTLLGTFFGQSGIKVLFALPAMITIEPNSPSARTNVRNTPVKSPGKTDGTVTFQKVIHGLAPNVNAASS